MSSRQVLADEAGHAIHNLILLDLYKLIPDRLVHGMDLFGGGKRLVRHTCKALNCRPSAFRP